MTRWLSVLAVAGGLVAAGASAPTAAASEPGQLRVDDRAGVFTSDGVKKAEDAFRAVTFKSPTHMTVVTYAKVPENKRSAFDAVKDDQAARGRFFREWAEELARDRHARGPFVLINMEPGHVRVIDDRQTDVRRGFGDDKLDAVRKRLTDALGAAAKQSGDEAKRTRDAGLLTAVNYVADELKNTSAPEAGSRAAARDDGGRRAGGGGSGIMGWVCIGLCVLLGVWLVVGLIRAFTGGGGGGYGGGGYGPGYGGGGGGFMSSLLGGMFGAAAGMYLYDSFMGGHNSASAADAGAAGGDYGDTGAGDYAGGGDAGGDFGGDAGDAGGGDFGGDFGGGDAGGGDFGGGDFGGGGGDFGGGDW